MTTRTFELKPAVRERVPLLIGLVGPSGSGKTWSALRLAEGIRRVAGGDVAVIDTESRRALHYADQFRFRHVDFRAPFGSLDYLAAIQACVKAGAGVVVIDSASHEHEGPGGMVDFQERELDRMAGDDQQKRERVKMLAWAKPKAARRKFVAGVLQLNCNFVFCFRAKSVSKPVKVNGRTEVVPQGFTPISGDELVFEMTLNALLPPRSDGVPQWESEYPGEKMAMKLPAQFRGLLKPGAQLSEDVGEQLALWAAGSAARSYGLDDLLAGYGKVKTRAEWDAMEKARETVWRSLDKDGKTRAKAASEAAAKPFSAPEKPPPDHVPGVGDPNFDPPPGELFDDRKPHTGIPH